MGLKGRGKGIDTIDNGHVHKTRFTGHVNVKGKEDQTPYGERKP